MPAKTKTKNNSKLPCYLFKKLDKNFAIATENGDFYELKPDAYTRLKNWNKLLSRHKQEKYSTVNTARRLGIPADITKCFLNSNGKKKNKFQENVSRGVSDLTLNLTSLCNLSCIYCWNDQGKYSNRAFQKKYRLEKYKSQDKQMMSKETACKAVDMLIRLKNKERNLVVDFYGGEPLLNLSVMREVIDYCRKNEKKWKVNIRFLIATNGTLLTARVAEELISKGVQIAISIDGPKNIQNHNRPFTSGQGSFETIAGNIRQMPKAILKRLVARATVTPYYADMICLYKSLRKLGFERIELFESEDACHKITPQREAAFFMKHEQYQDLFKKYEKLAKFYIKEVESGFLDYRKTFFNRFFKLMQRLYYQRQVSGGCPAGVGQLAVAVDGAIYPCTAFIGIKNFKLGDISSGLNRNKYSSFMKKADKRIDNCLGCEIFSLCRATGSCLNLNYYYCKDISKPYKLGCEFFKFKIQLAIATLSILLNKMPRKLNGLFGNDPAGARGKVY